MLFSVCNAELIDESPIRYWQRSPRDFSREWERAVKEGTLEIDGSNEVAFLRSILKALDISPHSQLLVFSTTSFQVDKISPNVPRALFFNENHYIGWVPGGDIEVATVGPRTGMNFYQVPVPGEGAAPEFIRNSSCLACHGGNAETPFPRTLVFSVFATEEGAQVLRGSSHHVDHRTPLEKRWGGWYVTGTVSGPRHRGNFFSTNDPTLSEAISLEAGDKDMGAHRIDLADVVDLSAYPARTSDILPLLIFEHQTRAHNQLMRAYGHSRIALWKDDGFFSDQPLQEETVTVLERETDRLLEIFLFKDEASLSQYTFKPSESYRKHFLEQARRDSQGRSLRDLQLEDRLFRYRFSYMVYSDAFGYLPDEFKSVFFKRLTEILAGKEPTYSYLPAAERQAIREILSATHPEVPKH